MSGYYDGARADEARRMGWLDPAEAAGQDASLAELMEALRMQSDLQLTGGEVEGLRSRIRSRLFGARNGFRVGRAGDRMDCGHENVNAGCTTFDGVIHDAEVVDDDS